jgi:hypothetical protein
MWENARWGSCKFEEKRKTLGSFTTQGIQRLK